MTTETKTTEPTTTDTPPFETPNPCRREITVTIPAETVAAEAESILKRYQKLARVPGFRKGKVPASLVKQRFAEEIKGEIVEALVPRYFREETQKQKLQPVSQPRVTDLHFHDGEPLTFKASFEILPEFEVAPYGDLHIEKMDATITDEDVEQALNNLGEQRATYHPVEEGHALADGEFAVVSFKGTARQGDAEGEAKPVEVDEVMVQIAGENTIPEFSENLRGARAGEQRSFEVKYADDFSDKRLAGKTMDYEVNVREIKTRSVPELNDEFARELGADFNTLDDLRARLRENMIAEKRHAAEHKGKDQIVEELVKRNDFPVPESMLEQQVDVRLERGLRALAAQGMKTEDMKRMDFARLRAGQREAAVREVKASLILEQIADKEQIEVPEEELDGELQALAEHSKQTLEQVRARLTQDGGLDRIRHRLRNEKTLDFLYRKSG